MTNTDKMSRTLVIDGKAQAWERPGENKYGYRYTKSNTRKAEEEIAYKWIQTYGRCGYNKDVPLKLTVVIGKVRPKSSKRKYPTVKPDVDNYSKLIMDALNGIAYHDDAQIVEKQVIKRYTDMEYTYIKLEEINEEG